jgi:predicted transcriptional regulator
VKVIFISVFVGIFFPLYLYLIIVGSKLITHILYRTHRKHGHEISQNFSQKYVFLSSSRVNLQKQTVCQLKFKGRSYQIRLTEVVSLNRYWLGHEVLNFETFV